MVKPPSNNLSAVADKLFDGLWRFCGVGALRVNPRFDSIIPCPRQKAEEPKYIDHYIKNLKKHSDPNMGTFKLVTSKVIWCTAFFTFVFLFSRRLNFCSDFFSLVGKWLDKKSEHNFQIHVFATWETNNFNAHIANYLMK